MRVEQSTASSTNAKFNRPAHAWAGVPRPARYMMRGAATDREWENTMTETWESPAFDEIRMDAEIGSYADDLAEERD
ncbi:hypothetical protein [Elioraea rosea]|uniref:hypothetical protein n=1 Tax=Elioraea rosea TaxID=2492390 RepID=UPI00118233A3|nr:hypothetical protein [Elioraea rosea]